MPDARACCAHLAVMEAEEIDGAPRGAMRKEMTDEQHLIRAGWNAGPGLMQRPGEAGGSRGAGSRAGGGSSPDNVTAGRHCQTPACVLARPKGRAKAKLVVEAPRFLKRPETWRIWVVDSNDAALFDRRLAPRPAVLIRAWWPAGCCECPPDGL